MRSQWDRRILQLTSFGQFGHLVPHQKSLQYPSRTRKNHKYSRWESGPSPDVSWITCCDHGYGRPWIGDSESNFKSQAPSTKQIRIFEAQNSKQHHQKNNSIASYALVRRETIVLIIWDWNFEFVCDLWFVIWCLLTTYTCPVLCSCPQCHHSDLWNIRSRTYQVQPLGHNRHRACQSRGVSETLPASLWCPPVP